MENQVLIVVLKENLRAQEICDVIQNLQLSPKVLCVKTIESVVADALPEVHRT